MRLRPDRLPADWIVPDWPAPASVRCFITTRLGGVSLGKFSSLNLGSTVGDEPVAVERNRARVLAHLPAEPRWLRQVHSARVVAAQEADSVEPADAAVAHRSGLVCAVTIADCMPVLFCDRTGSRVGIAHAGWRGLSSGVLEHTIAALACSPADVVAFLGPAIGPSAFEVGADVWAAFTSADRSAAMCFHPCPFTPPGARKWRADLYALARQRLQRAGVTAVFGGGWCTYSEPQRFFSYRRDGPTGRQAALIWIDEAPRNSQ